jgi:uncharacterized membrane protein
MSALTESLKIVFIIIMCCIFVYLAYFLDGQENIGIPFTGDNAFFPEVKANGDPWYSRVVTPGEFEATKWIVNNTNKSDKFVADIFGAELIMGMTTRVSTVGGDWANAPNPVKYMGDTNTIYVNDNSSTAHQLAIENKANLIFLPKRYTFSGYGWEWPNYEKFNDPNYFELLYKNDEVSIYKVL